jgi:hypothetical protein
MSGPIVEPPRTLMLPAFSLNPYRMPDGLGRTLVYVATGRRNARGGTRLFRFKRRDVSR